MEITDYGLNGSTIYVEDSHDYWTDLFSADFFDFVAEDQHYIHDRNSQQITVPAYAPTIDKARATVSALPFIGATLTYEQFFDQHSNSIESLLARYIETIDVDWQEHEGEGIEDTEESDHFLYNKEARAFSY